MAGLQADNQGAVVIGIELGPVHGDHDFGAFTDYIRDPIFEEAPHVKFGIGQQAIDLFDRMLSIKPTDERKTIADGMDSQ